MKRAAQIIGVLVLALIIGFTVWNDWLRRAAVPPPAAPAAKALVEQEIVGIGAILKTDSDTGLARIMGALPNSPAAKAGLSPGMLIQKIDDTWTDGLGLQECVGLIRGTVGTKLRLEVWDPEEDVTNAVELTRERVAVPQTPADF
jgi:C-terminal processing protease CtpA/Prc